MAEITEKMGRRYGNPTIGTAWRVIGNLGQRVAKNGLTEVA
jgi:hypothetical protein